MPASVGLCRRSTRAYVASLPPRASQFRILGENSFAGRRWHHFQPVSRAFVATSGARSFLRQKDLISQRIPQYSFARKSHGLPPTPEVADAINASVELELRLRGDMRDLDDIDDYEYNQIFNDIEAFESYDDEVQPKPPRLRPRAVKPCAFDCESSTWKYGAIGAKTLDRERILKVASWNLFSSQSNSSVLATAALDHLKSLFGDEPDDLVVMLQQIQPKTLKVIRESNWVQQNFVISDQEAPKSDAGGDEKSNRDFTLLLVPKTLAITNCFRWPFHPKKLTDSLVVDIALSKKDGSSSSTEVLRLCTTQLDPDQADEMHRLGDIALIQDLIKGKHTNDTDNTLVHATIATGGMSINSNEQRFHQMHGVGVLKFRDHERSSKHRRPRPRERNGTDTPEKKPAKILFNGSLKTLAVEEAQDRTGKLGRFAVGLRTRVGSEDVPVSDHFGIVVGISVQ